MDLRSAIHAAIVLAMAASVVVVSVGQGTAQTTAPATKTDPKINEPFKRPDVKAYIKKFESDDREVYQTAARDRRGPWLEARDDGGRRRRRHGIVHAAVRRESRPDGTVYAVDIAPGSSRTSRPKPRKQATHRS